MNDLQKKKGGVKKIIKVIKWFYPGLRIKRWIFLLMIGILFIFASSLDIKGTDFIWKFFSKVLFAIGIIIFIFGTIYLLKSFFEVIYPHKLKDKGLIDIIYEKRFLSKGPKIIALGGGHGLSTILEGLKEYTSNIVAIVTVADEGGSSGRLREEFGILPPGDIRNCLVSLAEAPQLMRDLFQHRFKEGEGMKGHSFGNLFITALTDVTGSFKDAVEESCRVLAVRGRVVPSSLDKVRLRAQYHDGSVMEGEDRIPDEGKPIKRMYLIPQGAQANPEAIEAIKEAELIIFGPGSLFTSILPNFLIGEMSEEVAKKNTLKLYICNVMTQSGETDGFTAADHLETLINHTRNAIANCCLVNSGRLKYSLLLRYAQEKSFPVIFDRERLKRMGVEVFEANVVSEVDYLRHNPQKTAREIMNIYNYWRKKWKGAKKKLS